MRLPCFLVLFDIVKKYDFGHSCGNGREMDIVVNEDGFVVDTAYI